MIQSHRRLYNYLRSHIRMMLSLYAVPVVELWWFQFKILFLNNHMNSVYHMHFYMISFIVYFIFLSKTRAR